MDGKFINQLNSFNNCYKYGGIETDEFGDKVGCYINNEKITNLSVNTETVKKNDFKKLKKEADIILNDLNEKNYSKLKNLQSHTRKNYL